MNKLLKLIATVFAVAAFSSPASAQLSGFLSLDTGVSPLSFSTRVGLNYRTDLNATTSLVFRLRYNFNISPASTSSLGLSAQLNSQLNDKLTVGAVLESGLNSIGLNNSIPLTIRPYATYTLLSSDALTASASLYLNAAILPSFVLSPWLGLDASYAAGNLAVDFGLEADFTVVPGFSFDALYGYVHGTYALNPALTGILGVAVAVDSSGFALTNNFYGPDYDGIYGGLQYNLSNAFGVRLTGGYFGGGYITLTGILR
jgi:hypothetical protein